MVRRAFFKGLPDNAKNSFLQVKVTPPFSTGSLHDLCIEVIKRHETLMATLSAPVESVNFVKTDRSGKRDDFKGPCFYCGKNGHKKSECKGRLSDESKGIHQNKRGGDNKPAGGANAAGTAAKGQGNKTKPPFRK